MDRKTTRASGLIGGIFGGLLVIWLGVSFYLVMTRMLTWAEWGAWFPLGIAALFLLQGIAWLFIPGMRKNFIGMLIPALFLAVTGLVPILGGGWHAWGEWWPMVIVAVGLVIIISTVWAILSRTRKNDKE